MAKNTFTFPTASVNKKLFSLVSFKGVDYNPYESQVSLENAVEMVNFIRKNELNQARYGFEEVVKASPFVFHVLKENGSFEEKISPAQINGVWSFVAEDSKNHLVAHIGNILWEINGLDENQTFLNVTMKPLVKTFIDPIDRKTYSQSLEISNRKSQAFVGSNRLYILGGNDIFILRFKTDGIFEITNLENSKEVYIPLTTIGITYKDSAISQRSPLDDTNMATQWRKNKLISGTYIDDGETVRTTRFFDYELDTSIIPKKQEDLNDLEIVVEEILNIEE